MKKLIALIVVVLLLWPSVAFAMLPISEAMKEEREKLEASGRLSNEYLNHSVIDLVYIEQGSVSTYTYVGINEDLAINEFEVSPNTVREAGNKITRFVFELTNRYRPETELSVSSVRDDLTVHIYTYGAMKDEAMWAVVYGLPDCLSNPPYEWEDDDDDSSDSTSGDSSDSNSGSYIDKYSPENITTTLASIFSIGSTTYVVGEETRTMDVAPEIKDERTFVPIRYLVYSLGVTEEGITWNEKKQEITLTKDDSTIGLTIGSNIQTVNGEEREMDVAPYIKNGRTMLPARWVAEPFGAKVDWDEATQQVKIEMAQEQGQ